MLDVVETIIKEDYWEDSIVGVLFIFSSSLLKFSLYSSTRFPCSVSTLITNALKYLSSKLFISVSLVGFSDFFSCLLISFFFLCLYEIR